MANIHLTALGGEIFVLTFNRPDAGPNLFDLETLAELEAHLETLTKSGSTTRGLILASAHPLSFNHGHDFQALRGLTADAANVLLQRGQAALEKIAAAEFPSVALLHGEARGAGYELGLACDWRVASDDAATELGLPDTKFGLIPALGGSTRLPRLLGVPKALDVILGGQMLPAQEALLLGLVDEVAPREHLLLAARHWLSLGKHPRKLAHSAAVNAMVDAVIAPKERHEVQQRTHGNFPAMEKALEVVLKGSAAWDEADSLEREREVFCELLASVTTRELFHLRFARERAVGKMAASEAAAMAPIRRAAVSGAGVMGSGIAQCLSAHGVSVILRDLDAASVAAGMGNIAGIYAAEVRQRTLSERAARAGKDRISPAPTAVPLQRVDLVIEAASESLPVKTTIFQQLETLARPDAMLATCTSVFSIDALAAVTENPGRVLGLHFFDPVHKVELVEVIAGSRTAPEMVARAVHFVRTLGKVPVVVKDSPGFLVNRILAPYFIEAGALFWSGAEIKDLDAAMRDFGFAMGPLRWIDEVGADTALELAATLAKAFPARLHVPDVLPALQGTGLIGRKAGQGFYKYRKSATAVPNKEANKLRPPGRLKPPPRAELEERLVLLLVNEAARCLEERLVATAEEVDLAMVLGGGFPSFRGGPLRYADELTVSKIFEDLTRLSSSAGSQYAPCGLLREFAKSGKRFYPA